MRVEVYPLYLCGKMLPKTTRTNEPTYRGKLSITDFHLVSVRRMVTRAMLTHASDGHETSVLPELYDVQILCLEDSTMRIRGFEEVDGVQYAQTWSIKVVTNA